MSAPRLPTQEIRRRLEQALGRRCAYRDRFDDLEYVYFYRRWEKVKRGTVLLEERQISPFPRIPRILRLRAGIQKHFRDEFLAEEKVEGYNVRVCRSGNGLVAFTRSGHHCPFSSDRAEEFLGLRFFEDYPRHTLCVEIAGPENPYNEAFPPFVKEDVGFFVFDILDNDGRMLPPREKWELIEEYGLPAVSNYGVFHSNEIERLRALTLTLNSQGREGFVFKPLGKTGRRVKYVTPAANINDIRVSSELLEELPPHFYVNRISRFMLGIDELDLKLDEASIERIGKAILLGYQAAIQQQKKEGKIYQTFRCRFRNKKRAGELLEMLSRITSKVQVRKRGLEKRGDFYILTFDKIYLRSTSFLNMLFEGASLFD